MLNGLSNEAVSVLDESDCTPSLSSNNTNWSMTSSSCSTFDVSATSTHPTVRQFESRLSAIQMVPSDFKAVLKGSFAFDLSWNFDDDSKVRSTVDKKLIERSLKVRRVSNVKNNICVLNPF